MHPMLRNILAVLAGVVVGSVVNMGLINFSGTVIPPPIGADIATTEGLKAAMHLFEPKHFIFPFLAHALGTLAGAAVTAYIATVTRKFYLAMCIGIFFLVGGITAVAMLPSPMWFNVVDLAGAYLPMAWIGYQLATAMSRATQAGLPAK